VGKETVRDCIDLLATDGFIGRSPPEYYTVGGVVRSHCLIYTVHDYDEPVDNSKMLDGLARQKSARKNKKINKNELLEVVKDLGQTPILLLGEYVNELRELWEKPDIHAKFYIMYEVKTKKNAEDVISECNGKYVNNDMFLTLELTNFKWEKQDLYLKFIEDNNQSAIFIMSEHDSVNAPFLSRIRKCLKKSPVQVRELKFEPIHKGYSSYTKKQGYYYSFDKMLNHALEDCPELMPLTVTNPNANAPIRKIDMLISSLSLKGSTYIDVLSSEPDPADDVPVETKYLSLVLKRADLVKSGIGEYESAINGEGDCSNEDS
jgi:hypothetical protein